MRHFLPHSEMYEEYNRVQKPLLPLFEGKLPSIGKGEIWGGLDLLVRLELGLSEHRETSFSDPNQLGFAIFSHCQFFSLKPEVLRFLSADPPPPNPRFPSFSTPPR